MSGAAQRLVFVGRRPPALEAARRLGLRVLLWSQRPPQRAAESVVAAYHPWQPGAPAASAAAAFAPHGPVAAVLALTEGSVAPAAELRRRLGLPGLSPVAADRCTDKLLMKEAVRAAGLPCARFAAAADGLDRDGLVTRLGLPIFLKSRRGSGGRSCRRLAAPGEVPDELSAEMIAEAAIVGEEMSVEMLVGGGRRLFANLTEYLEPGWANLVPRPTPPAQERQILALADAAIDALGVARGIVHLELFLTPDGPVFGELAARPPGGHLLRLIELAWGFDLWESWLRLELGELPAPPAAPGRCAGMRLFHPGPGNLRAVCGAGEAAALPGVVELALLYRPGQTLPPRLGTGQEAAHLLAAGDDREEVVRTLARAAELLRFELEPV